MIWNREEYIAHMTFQDIGKEMFTELFGLLIGGVDEWKNQNASTAEIDLSAFAWDNVKYIWLPCHTGARTGLTTIPVEETDEHIISIDNMGRKQKLCKSSGATLPLPLEYPVKCFDDWLKIKHWYEFDERRVDKEKLLEAKKLQDKGYLTLAGFPGGFDEPRQLMGDEALCMAYYEEPELIKDILDTIADTALKVFERVCDIVIIDNLTIHEDMAGKTGPLAGPNIVSEFMKPYYLKVWNHCKSHGTKLFSQDCDGNINALIDIFLESGVNILYPFEPNAGMDIVQCRKKYGNRVAFKGGLDKFALCKTKNDILNELEYKMSPLMRGGGTVFALDHRIPNGVSIENYRYYAKLGKELLGLASSDSSPFVRMAF